MDQPLIPLDLARMLWGDAPPLFLAEIVLRTAVIYVYTLALLRWVGGRGVAQLSLVEFLLVIALGSAVGDVAFYPDVPMLHAMLVITVVVGINKGLDWLIQRHDRAKTAIDGRPVQIVQAGRLSCEGLAQRNLGAAEALALLRVAGIRNLGQVEAAYLEADGNLSLFRQEPPRPGLSIVPPHEIAPPAPAIAGQDACCARCGTHAPALRRLAEHPCEECGHGDWAAPQVAG